MSENLQTRIYTKKPEKDSFFNFQIDWRLLLAFFFILFIIGVVPAIIYSIKYLFSSPRRGGGGLEKDTCQGMALFTFSDFIQTKSVDYLRSFVTGNSF